MFRISKSKESFHNLGWSMGFSDGSGTRVEIMVSEKVPAMGDLLSNHQQILLYRLYFFYTSSHFSCHCLLTSGITGMNHYLLCIVLIPPLVMTCWLSLG
jgi:hypothetical protein